VNRSEPAGLHGDADQRSVGLEVDILGLGVTSAAFRHRFPLVPAAGRGRELPSTSKSAKTGKTPMPPRGLPAPLEEHRRTPLAKADRGYR
jgi:hypothetical protein